MLTKVSAKISTYIVKRMVYLAYLISLRITIEHIAEKELSTQRRSTVCVINRNSRLVNVFECGSLALRTRKIADKCIRSYNPVCTIYVK